MPKLQQTVVATTTQTIKLAPKVAAKLRAEFKVYAELHAQKKAIEAKMDEHKLVIAEIRDDTGEGSIELDGFKTTLVAPVRKKFNPKKFVMNGGDLAIYNQSIEEKPSKAYERITIPGDKEAEED